MEENDGDEEADGTETTTDKTAHNGKRSTGKNKGKQPFKETAIQNEVVDVDVRMHEKNEPDAEEENKQPESTGDDKE